MLRKLHPHRDLFPGEHPEDLPGVAAHVQLGVSRMAVPFFVQRFDIRHLVHPVVLDEACVGVVGYQIIVFAVPGQGKGAHDVIRPIPAEAPLLSRRELEVAEADLAVL